MTCVTLAFFISFLAFETQAQLSMDHTCQGLCGIRENCLSNCRQNPGDAPEITPPEAGIKMCCPVLCGLGHTECLMHCTPYGKRRCSMREVQDNNYCYSNGKYDCFPCPASYRCTLDNTGSRGTCKNLKGGWQDY